METLATEDPGRQHTLLAQNQNEGGTPNQHRALPARSQKEIGGVGEDRQCAPPVRIRKEGARDAPQRPTGGAERQHAPTTCRQQEGGGVGGIPNQYSAPTAQG